MRKGERMVTSISSPCFVPHQNRHRLSYSVCRLTESSILLSVNSLPNDKILDWSNLKAFADDQINVTQELKFVLGREENIIGKGENAGYQHFLFFPQC